MNFALASAAVRRSPCVVVAVCSCCAGLCFGDCASPSHSECSRRVVDGDVAPQTKPQKFLNSAIERDETVNLLGRISLTCGHNSRS